MASEVFFIGLGRTVCTHATMGSGAGDTSSELLFEHPLSVASSTKETRIAGSRFSAITAWVDRCSIGLAMVQVSGIGIHEYQRISSVLSSTEKRENVQELHTRHGLAIGNTYQFFFRTDNRPRPGNRRLYPPGRQKLLFEVRCEPEPTEELCLFKTPSAHNVVNFN